MLASFEDLFCSTGPSLVGTYTSYPDTRSLLGPLERLDKPRGTPPPGSAWPG